MLHALMQVARRSEADSTFAMYQWLDLDNAALMGGGLHFAVFQGTSNGGQRVSNLRR
jgi:hypothetical protein